MMTKKRMAIDLNTAPLALSVLALSVLLLSPVAQSSGGYGGSGGGTSTRQTDPVYEHGKAIYKGRIKKYAEFSFCLISEQPVALKTDESADQIDASATSSTPVVKIKSSTIKPYKRVSYQALADQLVNCDKPEQKAFGYLERTDLVSLIYYLNKRYRLRLKEG